MTIEIVEVDTGDVVLSCAVAGPADGKIILALHGFPDSRATFFPLLPALTARGYRVVMPALRGYWPSGLAQSGRHHAIAAGDDAVFLASHFARGDRVRLVGHDWGALAAFAAAARAPERFSHLVTMAVPHPAALISRVRPKQLERSWYVAMFQLPFVAESRLAKDDLALVDRLWRDWSPDYHASADELRAAKDGIRERIGPVLAYYRALTSPRVQREGRAASGPVAIPAIHLHGENDGCIGIECTEDAAANYQAGYALHRIAGAGHFFIQEKPDEVSRILIDFFG